MSDDIKLDTRKLDELTNIFKQRAPKVKIGVMGERAQIGAFHEFGTANLPVRSFLRMPLEMYFKNKIENSQRFDESLLHEILDDGSLFPWGEAVAEEAYELIMDAFATNGFGNWKPLEQSTAKRKGNDQILVETGQLRDSVYTEVE